MWLTVAGKSHDETRELRSLFEKQLKELYWAEHKMQYFLPDIAENVFSRDLADVLKDEGLQAKLHFERLEQIFTAIGIQPEKCKYEALYCLVNEAEGFIESTKTGVVRDAAIIAVLQKIKHYEIACYGTMRAYAIALREEDVVTLLNNSLTEEKEADLKLSEVAESHINIEAADKEI